MRRLLPLLLVAAALPAWAAATLPGLQDALAAWKQDPLAQYAPKATAEAEALVGAALLASREGRAGEAAKALDAAREALDGARASARRFAKRYEAALDAVREARAVADAFTRFAEPKDRLPDMADVRLAEEAVREAVRAWEAGRIPNADAKMQQARAKAEGWLSAHWKDYDAFTGRLLRRASRAGAKRYALATYAKAKQARLALEAFVDGEGDKPARPELAAVLAHKARALAERVRAFVKDPALLEDHLEKDRAFRLALAQALGMAVRDADDPLADVDAGDLLAKAQALREALDKERRARAEALAGARARCREQVAAARHEAEAGCRARIAEIKEAMRAKLARETLPARRQQKLFGLFAPREAEVFVSSKGEVRIRLLGLRFAAGRTRLPKDARALLARVAEAIALYPGARVRVEGYTDNSGDARANQRLSLARAKAVAEALVRLGVPADRLVAYGYGEAHPIASNATRAGRARNRRIEVVIEPR